MSEVTVRARGVGVDLGGVPVLRDVDLDVRPGDFLGLVGPNGAGKTTLLRALLGLVPLAEGSVELCGTSPRRATRRVAYVPQRHAFVWDFPISVEQVAMTGRVRHVGWLRGPRVHDYRCVRRALRRVEMADLSARTIGDLSGGQKQRVLIARALAAEPDVLVLDEPFTGVDMPTQELLTILLRDLAREGMTVVTTTHDLAGAMATCSRIGLVNRGIVAEGTPEDMRDPELWMRAFGVSAGSPLLASVGAHVDVVDDDWEEVAC